MRPAAPGLRLMPSRAAAEARPWPMPQPSAASPIARPAPSAAMACAPPPAPAASAAPCAKALVEIRVVSDAITSASFFLDMTEVSFGCGAGFRPFFAEKLPNWDLSVLDGDGFAAPKALPRALARGGARCRCGWGGGGGRREPKPQ